MSLVHFALSSSRFWSKQPEFRSFSVCLPRSHWCAKLRQGVSSCLRETRSIDTSSMLIELHRDHCVRWTERLPLQRFSIHSTGETESIQRWSKSSARPRTNVPWCGRRRMALIAEMEFFVTSEAIFHRFVQFIVDLSLCDTVFRDDLFNRSIHFSRNHHRLRWRIFGNELTPKMIDFWLFNCFRSIFIVLIRLNRSHLVTSEDRFYATIGMIRLMLIFVCLWMIGDLNCLWYEPFAVRIILQVDTMTRTCRPLEQIVLSASWRRISKISI